MDVRSIPVVDPQNITDEERKRLLNREKCRLYRSRHKEKNATYQREFRRANVNTVPSMIYQTLQRRINGLNQTINKHIAEPKKNSAYIIQRARDNIARLTADQSALNYTPRTK
jgi:hypothetical protein